MKLLKFLQTEFGLPRREAFEKVRGHCIKVNGKVIEDSGYQLKVGDEVEAGTRHGKFVQGHIERKIIPFYKPKGVLCSHSDPHYDETFFDVLPDEVKSIKPLYLVGRLDKDSHGLVLLTNDGDFVQEMTHPSSHVEKEYEVEVDKKFQEEELKQIRKGLIILEQEDLGKTKPVVIEQIANSPKQIVYRIILTEGRNRQIRRICEMFGKEVLDLRRVRIGEYKL